MKRKLLILIFLLVSLLLASLGYSADSRQHLFEQGNQAFQNKQYEAAIRFYTQILEMGYESADLFYNLGNAYYKLGQIAPAILNYERALKLDPNDEDVQFNLQIAKLNLSDEIPEIPELFYIRYFKKFRSLFSIHTLTILSLSFYILFFAFTIVWLLSKKSGLRVAMKWGTIVSLVFLLLFSGTFISKIMDMNKNVHAIIMVPEVVARSAPSEDGTEIFTIHEGLKVKITDRRGEWVEIRLSDGKEGWLPADKLEAI